VAICQVIIKGCGLNGLREEPERDSRLRQEISEKNKQSHKPHPWNTPQGMRHPVLLPRFVFGDEELIESLSHPPRHENPVRAKLVKHPGDWPWSSWCHYYRGEGPAANGPLGMIVKAIGRMEQRRRAHPFQNRKGRPPKNF
jgi:hypothetical protein